MTQQTAYFIYMHHHKYHCTLYMVYHNNFILQHSSSEHELGWAAHHPLMECVAGVLDAP